MDIWIRVVTERVGRRTKKTIVNSSPAAMRTEKRKSHPGSRENDTWGSSVKQQRRKNTEHARSGRVETEQNTTDLHHPSCYSSKAELGSGRKDEGLGC